LEHFHQLIRVKCEKVAVLEMRTHASWYVKGLRNAGHIKDQINRAKTAVQLEKIINDYFAELIIEQE
jgi:tRNA-dihydrouridine synthase